MKTITIEIEEATYDHLANAYREAFKHATPSEIDANVLAFIGGAADSFQKVPKKELVEGWSVKWSRRRR